jgi:hypothetical protein
MMRAPRCPRHPGVGTLEDCPACEELGERLEDPDRGDAEAHYERMERDFEKSIEAMCP